MYLLYLFVLADDLLASNWVVLDTVVPRVDDKFAESTEPTVAADSEERRVKERVIFAQVVFALRSNISTDHKQCLFICLR